jgi:acetylornithine/N-succinyldiaminopimelate aminotransferase
MTTEAIDSTRSSLMDTYARPPVTFVSGRGAVLVDTEGKEYLDFLSGIAVTSLGHAHPRVTEALAHQASKLVHVSNLFGNELAGPLAATIDRLIGDGEPAGGQVFFGNSGAEANECAIKLARRYGSISGDSPRYTVLSALGSFHGRTLATLHATGQPSKHAAFEPLPAGFSHVAYGDMAALAEAADPGVVAAILLEPIQGEGGVVPAPPEYLAAVRRLCDERGILLMMDEIQTGLGRTGRWFGFQHAGIMPDVVTMAKALGNGVPIGACWARRYVASAFHPGDHGSTFGGQPLAAAASAATLATLQEIGAPELAAAAGERLSVGLSALPGVDHVRGAGLLLGIVLDPSLDAKAIVNACLGAGLVLNVPSPGVIRLAPPLTVTDDEIDSAVAIIAQVLEAAR